MIINNDHVACRHSGHHSQAHALEVAVHGAQAQGGRQLERETEEVDKVSLEERQVEREGVLNKGRAPEEQTKLHPVANSCQNKPSDRLSLFFLSTFLPVRIIFYVDVCVCVCVCVDCSID